MKTRKWYEWAYATRWIACMMAFLLGALARLAWAHNTWDKWVIAAVVLTGIVAGIEWLERAASKPRPRVYPTDYRLDEILEREHWGLVPVSVPVGQDDVDVAWVVHEYHMQHPRIRTLAQGKTPLDAVFNALQAVIMRDHGPKANR